MLALGDFDHRAQVGRAEEVRSGKAVGPAGGVGHEVDRDARGVGSQQRVGRQVGRQVGVDRAFDVHGLSDGLDDEGGVADVGQVGGEVEARGDCVGLVRSDQAVLDHQFEIAGDFATGGVEGCRVGVEDGDLVPGQRKYLRDAVAHEAGAEDADGGALVSDLRDSLEAAYSRHARRADGGRQSPRGRGSATEVGTVR